MSGTLLAAVDPRAPAMPQPEPVAGDAGLSGTPLPPREPPAPTRVVSENWEPAAEPDAVESAFEYRWNLRAGILTLPAGPTGEARNQPDAAGYDALRSRTEPRRGSLRFSPSGGPQQPQRPAPVDYGPEEQGPPMPDRGGASGALDLVLNTLLAAQQGLSEGALEEAQIVTLPEVQRLLHNPNDGDPIDTPTRLRAVQAAAQAAGIEVAFRMGPMGRIEAVQRTPEMETSGGAFGRVADAVGRLFGLGMVDPLAGAAAMAKRGMADAGTVMSAGAGPARQLRPIPTDWRFVAERTDGAPSHFLRLQSQDNTTQYYARLEDAAQEGAPGVFYLSMVRNEARFTSGVGPEFYLKIAEYAAQQGGRLIVGAEATPQARRVHQELERQGLAREISPESLGPQGRAAFSAPNEDGSPRRLFEIIPRTGGAQ